MGRRTNLLLGIAALILVAGFFGLIAFVLGGGFGNTYQVTATFDRAGQLLDEGGDVKLRGVLVGTIGSKEVDADGAATVVLLMDPSQRVPSNVLATIRGKTLFGQKFIELRDAPEPPDGFLEDGDEIPIERTTGAFELEQVLDRALPFLEAIEPGDLSGLLSALAQGVAGQEEAGRRTIDNGLVMLRSLNNSDLDRLLAGLDESATSLGQASPDLIAALEDLNSFNRTVVANRSEVEAALADVPEWMIALAEIMGDRLVDLKDLSNKGVDVVETVGDHRDELPFTVESLKLFTQAWVTNMSVGCFNSDGDNIGDIHPSLAGSTCWQIWNLSAEANKVPGAYGPEGPTPDTASAAYGAQLRHLLGVPYPEDVSPLSRLLYRPIQNSHGLIPEELL